MCTAKTNINGYSLHTTLLVFFVYCQSFCLFSGQSECSQFLCVCANVCSVSSRGVRQLVFIVQLQSPVAVCDNICVNSRDFAVIQSASRPSAANLHKLRGFHGNSVNGHSRPYLCISRGIKSIVVTWKQFRKWTNVDQCHVSHHSRCFAGTYDSSRSGISSRSLPLAVLYYAQESSTALEAVSTNFRQL